MSLKSVTNLSDKEMKDNNSSRAVYIFCRPCVQTFRGFATRYLNLGLRAIEDYVPFCHWGVLISSEHPPPTKKPGQRHKLRQPWKQTSSSYEMEVPILSERAQKVNVGSLEQYFPTRSKRLKNLIYLGKTTLSDGEVQGLGQMVIEYLEVEGGYHGLVRNCQHFVAFLAQVLFPDVKLPKRVDEVCGGIPGKLMHAPTGSEERVKKAREYCLQKFAEKSQI
jgi:hypothetical protein